MGHHMRRYILAHKVRRTKRGDELICIHPDPHHQPATNELAKARAQVKSGYATGCDWG